MRWPKRVASTVFRTHRTPQTKLSTQAKDRAMAPAPPRGQIERADRLPLRPQNTDGGAASFPRRLGATRRRCRATRLFLLETRPCRGAFEPPAHGTDTRAACPLTSGTLMMVPPPSHRHDTAPPSPTQIPRRAFRGNSARRSLEDTVTARLSRSRAQVGSGRAASSSRFSQMFVGEDTALPLSLIRRGGRPLARC